MSPPPSGYVERPDYRVDVLRRRNLVTAQAGDVVLASTENVLLVDEQDHGLVFYFPRDDVDLSKLVATDDHSRCPYKGEASYWRLAAASSSVSSSSSSSSSSSDGPPVVWTYDSPYPQVAEIAGYVAFYQDRVDVSVGVATPAVVGYSK